ncbi:hypothetical protein [Actinomadura sp. NTSP31]|uniref:hypothetical protein n=1 Tax=Actinomadura sp. NTSP31 TaxID=1735447 RepID=UPI0035BEEF74
MTSPAAQLQQLMARLDGQGHEVRIIKGRLFVIAPPRVAGEGSRLIDVIAATSRPDEHGCMTYNGERRRTEVITCAARSDDGGSLWFFDSAGEPIEPATHIVDATLRIGSRLACAQVGR